MMSCLINNHLRQCFGLAIILTSLFHIKVNVEAIVLLMVEVRQIINDKI
jgi:hypothetical protein